MLPVFYHFIIKRKTGNNSFDNFELTGIAVIKINGGNKMSIEDNKNIARRFIQVWGNGNLDIIDELADPSISVHYPSIPKIINSSKIFKQVMESFRSAFPDSVIRIDEEIAENDNVVLQWSFSGTHKGNMLGIPPSGMAVSWTGITIYHIAHGKVVLERGEEDFRGFLRQIGLAAQA